MSEMKRVTARRAVFNVFVLSGLVFSFPLLILFKLGSWGNPWNAMASALMLGFFGGACVALVYYATTADRFPALVTVDR